MPDEIVRLIDLLASPEMEDDTIGEALRELVQFCSDEVTMEFLIKGLSRRETDKAVSARPRECVDQLVRGEATARALDVQPGGSIARPGSTPTPVNLSKPILDETKSRDFSDIMDGYKEHTRVKQNLKRRVQNLAGLHAKGTGTNDDDVRSDVGIVVILGVIRMLVVMIQEENSILDLLSLEMTDQQAEI